MEEIQKKTRKVNTTTKEPKTTKASTAKKETKAAKVSAATKEPKATKATTAKKETKTTKASAATKEPKATKTTTAKKETKTTKASTTKKEPKTTKVASAKKEVKTTKASSVTKNAKAPKTSTVKKEINEEPKLTIIQEKREQSVPVNNFVKNQNEIKRENKNHMQSKRYIDISIGAIVCAIIIIGLIIFNVKLGVRAYNVMTKEEKANSNLEVDNNITVTQEIGNVLNNTNELVSEMQEKITFPQNVTASIYNKQAFNTNTIPNELKLMMGWAKAADEDKLISINEKNEQVEALEKDTMEETIKSIFGPEAKYKNESFNNTNISTFSTDCPNQGKITYKDGLYTSIASKDIENGISPLIYQEIQKVVKYTETLIVYTKVAYLDVENDEYIVYKDFSEEGFEEKLLEIEAEELFEDKIPNLCTGEGTVTIDANAELDTIREQLHTYKYTFTLDEETGEYYLSKFNKSLTEE